MLLTLLLNAFNIIRSLKELATPWRSLNLFTEKNIIFVLFDALEPLFLFNIQRQ